MIETERCIVRAFEEKDLDSFMTYRNNEEWMKYQGFKNLTKEQYRKSLLVSFNIEKGGQLAIADKATDELLGDLYLVKNDKTIAIGYSINPIYSRQGYISEVLKALLPKLEGEYPDYKIKAMIEKDNIPSKNLLLKLGFAYEGWIEEWQEEVYVYAGSEGYLMNKVYETERLILKVLDKSYAELVIDYYLRNKSFLEEWEPVKSEEFYTKQYQEEQIDNELYNIKNKKSFRLWVFKKEDSNKIIGSVGFNNIVWGSFLSCHLGYKLDKDEMNKGYITEAIQKGIEVMFNEFGLHRIEANIMPKNKRSLRVVEKLGFYNEGLAYKYLKINGKWEDHIHMVLLNDNV